MKKDRIDNKSKSKNSLDDISNSVMIESFFPTYILLDTLFSKEFINKAKSFHLKLGKTHAQEGLRQGYKLLLVATLQEYIDTIVRSPEVIGIEPDLDYRDYWAFTKGRGREITKGVDRTDHQISKYVAKASSFINEILTLNTWDSIEAFGDKIKSFRDCLHRVSEKAYMASKGKGRISTRDALLEAANGLLWSTSGNPLPIAHMYTDYFINRRDDEVAPQFLDEMLEDCNMSSGITRLDSAHLDPTFFPRRLPEHWSLGYAFALHESLKILTRDDKTRSSLTKLDNMIINIRDWHGVEKYDREMGAVYGMPKISSGYIYRPCLAITDDDRRPLMADVEVSQSPERLLSIFGNRARIVERGFPGAFGSFECLLDGAIKRSKRTKEAAKVAIIVHRDRWGQEDYSTAIFMPAYGLFSNASMWWVFYLI